MNIEMYALSKRTGKDDKQLMKMPVGEYYELYLTDKTYHQMLRQEMDKKK